ncbi:MULTISPECIES: ATP-binding protein [Pseudomonas]|jgi:two-component system C4-dicarboxylate transport sensor histidine kinase DctB|uniref:ATP-binding protein n=1 Tax=Pseudomonas TaxID=286 RepID=UPI000C88326B|nr:MULTISPECIES: ATP-binding protein [Pseudomonas]MDF9755367.1 two-component system C4-dicarboxylate transport sensor histidine kinase DctB [Pseudomonas hunanensis]PMZ99365.1 two-component sensor histidine kinase [Pseudomonas sp. FW305-42]PNA23246.1 two-component sensor histidine kinase [Pseudomonas sp. MPR-R1B]PNB25750.1 two-component sensor histidine kinase [Pseudomonas sp. DP16D-E2]PNB40975.1 two-component sensor histidine kinase [Pseudomonas sp. FW305-17]
MPSSFRTLRLGLIILLILVGTTLSAGWAMHQAKREAMATDARRAGQQLGLYANALHTLIERYRALPAVLALDPELIAALRGPVTEQVQDALNRKLERINGAANSSTLELLDRTGLAIAASNWRLPTTYVGSNYGFRPYFKQTRSQGSGRFYAVGVTSGVPGYFLASAVNDEHGRFLGAMVVKLEFPELEREWRQGNDILLVSDARGITFIANQDGWRYRELQPLSGADRAELAETRQYDKQPLVPLQHQALTRFTDTSHLTRVQGPDGTAEYLWERLPLEAEGWTLHLLRKPQVAEDGRNAALAAAAIWLSLVFAALFVSQRLRLARLRQRSREELKRQVEERTRELRTAQEGLVQSAKLAALGQMSAALAHEINQPLTTQRMQLETLRLLLDHGRHDEARQALEPLEQMLSRMAALTGHLKTFARNSPGGLRERLDLATVVDQALHLLDTRMRAENVEVALYLARPAWVRGDAIRLEQVLINLLRNALDAMADKRYKRLEIRIEADDAQWRLSVLDSGGGILDTDLCRVFDPFFTTKPVGEGLGLGLAISYGIVIDAGGHLQVENLPGGARFSLTLPRDLETVC